VVGQRKRPSGKNAPPVHGIKKCLVFLAVYNRISRQYLGQYRMIVSMKIFRHVALFQNTSSAGFLKFLKSTNFRFDAFRPQFTQSIAILKQRTCVSRNIKSTLTYEELIFLLFLFSCC
jgi:hypothetical protein